MPVARASMEKTCITCRHFRDGEYSRIYISPRCVVHGGDDCSFMRQYICGLDGDLYQPDEPRKGSQEWKNKPNANQQEPQR